MCGTFVCECVWWITRTKRKHLQLKPPSERVALLLRITISRKFFFFCLTVELKNEDSLFDANHHLKEVLTLLSNWTICLCPPVLLSTSSSNLRQNVSSQSESKISSDTQKTSLNHTGGWWTHPGVRCLLGDFVECLPWRSARTLCPGHRCTRQPGISNDQKLSGLFLPDWEGLHGTCRNSSDRHFSGRPALVAWHWAEKEYLESLKLNWIKYLIQSWIGIFEMFELNKNTKNVWHSAEQEWVKSS